MIQIVAHIYNATREIQSAKQCTPSVLVFFRKFNPKRLKKINLILRTTAMLNFDFNLTLFGVVLHQKLLLSPTYFSVNVYYNVHQPL